MSLNNGLRGGMGVVGSLYRRYRHGNGAWRDALLAPFVSPGDLVFDIGAHVGDCIASLRRLNARVIAVEPQPALGRMLRMLYARDTQVVALRALKHCQRLGDYRYNAALGASDRLLHPDWPLD
ncbi:hypothetical protein [Halochromatium salexigens]|uniref:hypothetical protein n=1 Tax=Halochromatium salexigens TaxID=49447 RepID=UPI0019137C8E